MVQLYFFVFFGPNILLKSCSQRNIYIYFFHNAHCTDLFTSVFAAYLCLLLKILLRSVDLRHHAGVSHIMLPANWYVGSPSAAIEIITTFCGLSSPPHPLLSHQLPSALIKHLILSNYENYEYLTLNRSCLLVLLQKDIFFFQESFVILLDLLNKKEDFFC